MNVKRPKSSAPSFNRISSHRSNVPQLSDFPRITLNEDKNVAVEIPAKSKSPKKKRRKVLLEKNSVGVPLKGSAIELGGVVSSKSKVSELVAASKSTQCVLKQENAVVEDSFADKMEDIVAVTVLPIPERPSMIESSSVIPYDTLPRVTKPSMSILSLYHRSFGGGSTGDKNHENDPHYCALAVKVSRYCSCCPIPPIKPMVDNDWINAPLVLQLQRHLLDDFDFLEECINLFFEQFSEDYCRNAFDFSMALYLLLLLHRDLNCPSAVHSTFWTGHSEMNGGNLASVLTRIHTLNKCRSHLKNILKILSNNHLDVLQPPVDISPLVLGGDVLENERPKRDNSTFADIRFRRMGHIRLEEGYEGAEHERGNIPDHVQPPALGSLKTPQEVLLTVSVPYLIGQLNQIIPWKVCSINDSLFYFFGERLYEVNESNLTKFQTLLAIHPNNFVEFYKEKVPSM